MQVHILQAKGTSAAFSGPPRTMLCGTAFLSPAKAEASLEAFKAKCCGDGLYDLDPATTTVAVLTLDLDETT